MKRIQIMIICIAIAVLTGCEVNSEYIDSQMKVVFTDGNKHVEITGIGKEIYFEQDNVRSIRGKEKMSNDNRYSYVRSKIGDEEKLYIMDTLNEKLIGSDKSELISIPNKYDVNQSKDTITITDNMNGKEVFSINLNDINFRKKDNEFSLLHYWSNTNRYLLLSDSNSSNQVLIDVSEQKFLEIPVNEQIFTTWSPGDNKVVLEPVYSAKVKKTYIWDINNNSIREIGEKFVPELRWTPDEKYIYYIDTTSFNGTGGYKIVRYDITNDCWNDIYSTKMNIQEESIKWISGDEFIFPAVAPTKTQDPVKMLMKPYTEYAVKVNIKNNKETVKELKAFLAKDYIWSYDNKYIYYLDENGFYKEEVNFGIK